MTTKTASFKVGSEVFKTSYTVFGDLKSGRRPLVVLNGGPGISHWYMLPHAELYRKRGRPVVLYDQLGSGDSTHNLLQHLGITHDFDLLGQSWGVTLAVEYIAAHQPAGLKHLVLTSGSASYPLWREALAGLRAQWPKDFQDMLSRHEMDGTTDAPEYQEGLVQFYRKHILNFEVWPPEALKSMAQMGEDPTVYRAMLGVNEFNMTGMLKDWSIIPKLGTVSCPTLILNGADDEVPDSCVAPLFYGIKRARWVTLGSSSHMAFWEEPAKYFQTVSDFLTDVGLEGSVDAQGTVARWFGKPWPSLCSN
ncbi:proline-specific peptidase [Russula aff. rugulosa BPL654]|nr:proline-specific peptidase [Russula aff. rugulosa BPL654]